MILLPVVHCAQCGIELDHDDPSWSAHPINDQPTPLCFACAAVLERSNA